MKKILGKLGVWLVKKFYTEMNMGILMRDVLLLVESPIDIEKVRAEMRTGVPHREIALRCKEIANDEVFNAVVNANIKYQMEHSFMRDKGASNSTFQYAQMSVYGASRVRTDIQALGATYKTEAEDVKFDRHSII